MSVWLGDVVTGAMVLVDAVTGAVVLVDAVTGAVVLVDAVTGAVVLVDAVTGAVVLVDAVTGVVVLVDVDGITCVRAVDELIRGRGLKMEDIAEVFCWGKSHVSGCFAWDGVLGAGITMSERFFKTLVPALLGMCSYTIG